jgi:hypothetical protein
MNKLVTTREPADEQAPASLEPGAGVFLPLATGEFLYGTIVGPGFIPGEVKVLWGDGDTYHIQASRLRSVDVLVGYKWKE